MQKYTLQYIVLELIEKLLRLKNFIHKNSVEQGNNSNNDIIIIFDNTINQIKDELQDIINVINDFDGSETNNEVFAIQSKLFTCYRAIKRIHNELNFVHTNWLKLETFTFVEQVVDTYFTSLKDEKVNIILSDEYTFLETNLSNRFGEITEAFYPRQDTASKSPTVVLPKIEYSNPLNWSIVIHELAHIDTQEINSITKDNKLYPDNLPQSQKDKLHKWAEEIYCDLKASSILGPAYFLSLCSFALLESLISGYSCSSGSHPPFAMRLQLIYKNLEKNNWSIPIAMPNNLVAKMHDHLYEMHGFIEKTIKETGMANQNIGINGLMKFYKVLDNLQITSDINTESLRAIDALVAKLKKKIPIGSYRDIVSDQIKIDVLSKEHEIGLTDIQFTEIRDSLTERNTQLWEILNSGWAYKLEHIIPLGEKLFFNDPEDNFDEKLMLYDEHLETLDDRLLTSIEISKLIDLIEH